MTRRLALLGAGLGLALAGGAAGFVPFRSRWSGATAHYRVSQVSYPAGSVQLSVTRASMEAWSQLPGCAFTFTDELSSDSRAALSHGDGVSGVAFSSQVQGSTLGVTFSDDIGARRRSADVLFNAGTRWSFDGSPSRGEFDYGSTARHEFGHALGLQHSDRGCRALMGGGCGTPGRVRQMTADDVAGAEFLYPDQGGSRVPDFTARDLRLAPATVVPGGTVSLEWQVLNAGQGDAAAGPSTAVLLSTNATLTLQDRVLGVTPAGPALRAGGARLERATVQVPAALTPGTYVLGLFLDPREQQGEADEGNNTLGLALRVTAPAPAPPPAPALVDWDVTGLTVTPAQVRAGEPVVLTLGLRQAGSALALERPEYRLLVSSNDTLSAGDALAHAEPPLPGSFPPGQHDQLTHGFAVSLPPGTWFLGVIVDPDDQSLEVREDNNQAVARLVVLDATAAPPSGAPPPTSAPPPASAPPASPPATGSTAAGATPASTPNTVAPVARRSGGSGCALQDHRGPASPPGAALLLSLALLLLRRRR